VCFTGRFIEQRTGDAPAARSPIDEQARNCAQSLSRSLERCRGEGRDFVRPDAMERYVADDAFVDLAYPSCEAVLGDEEAPRVVLEEDRIAICCMDRPHHVAQRFNVGVVPRSDLQGAHDARQVARRRVPIGGGLRG
jgi:hypothetical protein